MVGIGARRGIAGNCTYFSLLRIIATLGLCALTFGCSAELPYQAFEDAGIGDYDAALPTPPSPDTPEAEDDSRTLPGLPPTGPGADRGVAGPYPIVLAHGFFGFDDFAGTGFLNYFYGVRSYLQSRGEMQVFTPEVDPFNDSETRGRQLLREIEAILEETGAARVNIIGHSQGGLDARVVASLRPEIVESIVTVSTPHRGSKVADIVVGLVESPWFRGVVDELVRAVGRVLWNEAGEETSLFRGLEQLSSEGLVGFNTRYPIRAEIPSFSIAGRSGGEAGVRDCATDFSPPFVARFNSEMDPTDPLLSVSENAIDGTISRHYANDGIVRAVDARWGRFLGCIPADHFDEIGHLFGDGPGGGNTFNYRSFYGDLIDWLRSEGH